MEKSARAAKYDNFQLAQSGASPAVVTNLALNKPATQISTYTDAVAGRAVDGNTNGSYWSGSVTQTRPGALTYTYILKRMTNLPSLAEG